MHDPNTVINPDTKICEVLAGLAAKYARQWCYPSQDKLCELLQRFTGRTLSRRHLNRHLRALVRDGHLQRIRRHVRDRSGRLTLRSTVYVLAGRFLARLRRLVLAARAWLPAGAAPPPPLAVPTPAQHLRGSINPSYPRRP